jgi:hypothetical protein
MKPVSAFPTGGPPPLTIELARASKNAIQRQPFGWSRPLSFQDRARLEHRQRAAAVRRLVINDRGDAVVGRDCAKFALELLAFVDVHGKILYASPVSSRKIVILWPFGVVQ